MSDTHQKPQIGTRHHNKPLPAVPGIGGPQSVGVVPSSTDRAPSRSPPAYYLPSSAKEMFIYPMGSLEEQKQREKERKKKRKNEAEDEADDEEEDVEDVQRNKDEKRAEILKANRKRTRLYRTLVWVQFSFTMFTCVFILVIMVLLAIILVLLNKTITRADHAIRENPVSQMYMKLKHAVDRIPGPG